MTGIRESLQLCPYPLLVSISTPLLRQSYFVLSSAALGMHFLVGSYQVHNRTATPAPVWYAECAVFCALFFTTAARTKDRHHWVSPAAVLPAGRLATRSRWKHVLWILLPVGLAVALEDGCLLIGLQESCWSSACATAHGRRHKRGCGT